jgi:subtilase family serine protease
MQSIVAVGIVACFFPVQPQTRREVSPIVQQSADHGPAMRDQPVVVIVQLKLCDQDGFNKRVESLYDSGCTNYHRWMSPVEIACYGATAEQLAAVKRELESHGLIVLEVDRANSSIRARGITSQIEDAFQTRIHEFVKNGVTFSSNIVPVSPTGPSRHLNQGRVGPVPFAGR